MSAVSRIFSISRRLALLCALAAMAAGTSLQVARAADIFVAGTEDIPLMPGLSIVKGAGVVFDTPQGRIVEAYAEGPSSRKAVLDFYKETLPQLGWKAAGPTSFRREGELLRLELYEKQGALTVRFYISPS